MFFPKVLNIFFLILLVTCLIGCPSQGSDASNDFVEGTNVLPITPPPTVIGPSSAEATTQAPFTAFTFGVQVNRVTGSGFFSASAVALTGTVTTLPTTISFSSLSQIGTNPITFESAGTFLAPLIGPGTVLVTVTYNGEGSIAPYCFILGVGALGGITAGGGTTTCGGGAGGGGAGGGGGGGGSGGFDFSGVYVADCARSPGATCSAGLVGFVYIVVDYTPDPAGVTAGSATIFMMGPDEDDGITGCPIWISSGSSSTVTLPVATSTGTASAPVLTFPLIFVGDCASIGSPFTPGFPPAGFAAGSFSFTLSGGALPTGVLESFLGGIGGTWTGTGVAPCPQTSPPDTRTFTRISTTGTVAGLPFASFCPF